MCTGPKFRGGFTVEKVPRMGLTGGDLRVSGNRHGENRGENWIHRDFRRGFRTYRNKPFTTVPRSHSYIPLLRLFLLSAMFLSHGSTGGKVRNSSLGILTNGTPYFPLGCLQWMEGKVERVHGRVTQDRL